MQFLLIEDDAKVAELLRQGFAEAGHEIIVRCSGEEGLAYLTGGRPDAIFLDVSLLKVNGIKVLLRIKATHPGLPIILLTGQAAVGEVAEAKRFGIVEVIEKPRVLEHFSEALERLARRGPPAPAAPASGNHPTGHP